jgi:signal peptidase I
MTLAEPPVDPRLVARWVDAILADSYSRMQRREFFKYIVIILLAGAIWTLVVHGAVQNYEVAGQSMVPTFWDRDHVLVDPIAYHIGDPARGDIVVFRFPEDRSTLTLIKRIIGLPGDVVQVKPGVVLVNGHVLPEPYIFNLEPYSYGPARVPAGDYFVLGDNRTVSYDSHIWGFLPRGDIYGRVMVTYWPLGDFHLFGL